MFGSYNDAIYYHSPWQLYLVLFLVGLITISLTIIFYFLEKLKFFKNISFWYKQLFIGTLFGVSAILASELGVKLFSTAVANVRDAAPLVAGLIFGGPSGIIAGFIGGLYRFLMPYWQDGYGEYTQIACSISTLLAGIFAAVLRKTMFDNKPAQWYYGIAASVIMEAIHLAFVYITHVYEPYEVLEVIKIIAVPMILMNALIVGLSCLAINLFTLNDPNHKKHKLRTINEKLQLILLIFTVLGYVFSIGFVFTIQTTQAHETAESVLLINTSDISGAIIDESNNLSEKSGQEIAELINANGDTIKSGDKNQIDELLNGILAIYEGKVNGISLVKNDGTIAYSTDSKLVNFNMNDDENSQSFHETMIDYSRYVIPIDNYNINGQELTYKLFGEQIDQSIFDGYFLTTTTKQEMYLDSYGLTHFITISTAYRTVYRSGRIIIFDETGKIVTDDDNFPAIYIEITVDDLKKLDRYTLYQGTIFKQDYYYMYGTIESYYILSMFPLTDVTSGRDLIIYSNSFLLIAIFSIMFFLTFFMINSLLVKNIRKINKTLSLIIQGDLDQRIEPMKTREIEYLAEDINVTVETLKKYIEKAANRIDEELAFAKKIQYSSLPSVFPAFPNRKDFDIYATMKTARQVGGDFYDFYFVDQDAFAFLIADVSGKGIPASMFMMESKTMLKNYSTSEQEVSAVLTKTNNGLCQGNDANMFVTCWYAIVNLKSGDISFGNAGHNTPLVYRKGKGWEYIKQKKNMVLAGIDNISYLAQSLKLEKGDRIYLYTDGVTEAMRGDKVLYGEERLLAYLNAHQSDSLKEILEGVQKDIDLFIDGEDQFDDITMLIFEYKGN